ncbi:hypothetical protein PHLGIDRAFT_490945 [Phlebiopsis gigantea 11061_1 CR5-6]|uniref:Cytochrome P450 n=1 Tax=Phlebiopsis gigantea (strain 11061_1 CR5-6) TaxID=745531 RepID=A0A0C3NJY7_PHLG1|nr:hypothetical protein PHLGIDRAFT_490945 [Phlebiopsis gigantea 11061_1 CR5-6]
MLNFLSASFSKCYKFATVVSNASEGQPLMTPTLNVSYFGPIVFALCMIFLSEGFKLRHIPTEGGSALPILSFAGAYHFLHNTAEVLQRGYDKHKGGVFRVPLIDRWLVVITGSTLVDEVQRMPPDKVSFAHASAEFIGSVFVFGNEVLRDPYHVAVIRDRLTRGAATLFAGMCDEIEAAFGDAVPADTNGWVSLPAHATMRQVVARATGRMFVGLPLCRNEDYLKLTLDLVHDVRKTRNILTWIPRFLRPAVGKHVADRHSRAADCLRLIGPVVAARMAEMAKHGKDWRDRPNDLLQSLIEEIEKRGQGPYEIAQRLLLVNYVAIDTSSNSFTHALYHLASAPEYLIPLREEVERVIADEGWTKAAIGKMGKLDGFMRESQRVTGVITVAMLRKVMQPLTLSCGTHIPRGTLIAAPAAATHLDPANYSDPDTFDPFRHSCEKEEGRSSQRRQFATTSADYLAFGHGKQACPGRHIASSELKAMMAYLVLNYDVRMADGVRPADVHAAMAVLPCPDARVLFRKRVPLVY